MLVLKKGLQGVAIIDPKKQFGEPGQYTRVAPDDPTLIAQVACARVEGFELRYYYKDLATSGGEAIAAQIIITEIPPRHVQPFHTHQKLHELTTVLQGAIVAIDDEALTEADVAAIEAKGTIVREGETVIEDTGVRHTIMNPNRSYTTIYTLQVARIPLAEFPADWQR